MARDSRRGAAWGAATLQASNLDVSAYSDVESNEGRATTPGMSGTFMPSSKAQVLAGEIASIEQKCNFLEQRNRWLTDQLLRKQRAFIERTVFNIQKSKVLTLFQAWKNCMSELRLEHQLEQQTSSLAKCQQVAKELGAALAREQEVSRKEQGARRQVELEYEQLANAQAQFKQLSEQQAAQIQSLQRQLQLVMSCLSRNKSDAQAVVDTIDELETRVLDAQRQGAANEPIRTVLSLQSSTIEESVKLRDEAQEMMREMTGILQQNTPERERSRQPGKRQAEMARSWQIADTGGSLGASRSSVRTPSPMDGRFQSVSDIVSGFELGPSAASASETWATAPRTAVVSAGAQEQRSPIIGRQTIGGIATVDRADAARRR